MRTLIHSARLVTGGTIVGDSWVLFTGEVVSHVGTGDSWRAVHGTGDPAAMTVRDAGASWLVPGFIDIHCHGAGGFAFAEGADALREGLAVHRRHGTTRSLLSLATAPLADLEAGLDLIAAAAERDPLVLGAHLEGPFLDPTFRGAHDPALLRKPDPQTLRRLLDAGGGRIRQVTIAPELPGAERAITELAGAGIAVAVGHTSADYETALRAFDAGATILTHAFNGMPGIHHRAPGPVAAATRHPGVTLEVINDGIHVEPEVVRLAFSGAPRRIALVTDAMAATGAADGIYDLGAQSVTVEAGIARVVGSGALAGSTLTLDAALRRAVADVGIPLAEAVMAVTETPARAIGRGHDLGSLSVGYAADAVLLSDDLRVNDVYAGGRLVGTR
ncbi:N-acetylglucosamine-6-phosphate deacetylase [Microbacterium sp. A588]